jgi:rSAM/selenodomain-associated transferase 2
MISIIIPVLNEEAHLGSCIEAIKQYDDSCEIIIADGGSSDRTIEIAESSQGVKVVTTRKGRGLQMNAGAFSATGDILLFLHADTTLEDGWGQAIAGAVKDSSIVGGAFTFAIKNPAKKYRAVEQWVKLRCFLFRLPYGDQAIFVKRHVFKKLGGYKNIPLMEDVDLIERMKRLGRIVILETRALTSERRWGRKGLIYTAVLNQLIMFLYKIGVSPQKLARIYYR